MLIKIKSLSDFMQKYLQIIHNYSQLFGEEDPDEDVSPDTADPEAAGNKLFLISLISFLNLYV